MKVCGSEMTPPPASPTFDNTKRGFVRTTPSSDVLTTLQTQTAEDTFVITVKKQEKLHGLSIS